MSYDYLYYLSLFEVILKYYDELMSVRSTTGQIDNGRYSVVVMMLNMMMVNGEWVSYAHTASWMTFKWQESNSFQFFFLLFCFGKIVCLHSNVHNPELELILWNPTVFYDGWLFVGADDEHRFVILIVLEYLQVFFSVMLVSLPLMLMVIIFDCFFFFIAFLYGALAFDCIWSVFAFCFRLVVCMVFSLAYRCTHLRFSHDGVWMFVCGLLHFDFYFSFYFRFVMTLFSLFKLRLSLPRSFVFHFRGFELFNGFFLLL